MTTRQLKAFEEVGTHAVGNLSNLKVKTVAQGAIVDGADIDNFTFGELSFNADGERVVKQLAAVGNKSYLVAAPETRYMGELMGDFYNAVGERVRIVVLEPNYTRFDASAFELDPGDAAATPARAAVTEVQNGQVAHFNPASKKFMISAAATPHPDYATASAKLLVVNNEEDMAYTFGVPMARFEVTEA
jgi:hypothetical protein